MAGLTMTQSVGEVFSIPGSAYHRAGSRINVSSHATIECGIVSRTLSRLNQEPDFQVFWGNFRVCQGDCLSGDE